MKTKYSFDTQMQILSFKDQGISSRDIADHLGVSKSGVNDFYKAYQETKQVSKAGPKVLFFDLETSAALVYCFGRHKVFLNQDSIHTEGGKILCAGYRWLGEDKSHVLWNYSEVKAGSDYLICAKLWDLISQADIVVAHNGKQFDMRMLEVRCLSNGLPPLPSVKIIDTLELARNKFRFPSNKLDSLAAYLNLGRKVSHSGIDLWIRVQQGDAKALNEMVAYCEQDVDLLYGVFMELRNRGLVGGINFALYYNDLKTRCKTCGSDNLELTGRVVTTSAGLYREVQCNDCGTVHRQKDNKLSIDKRKKLLV